MEVFLNSGLVQACRDVLLNLFLFLTGAKSWAASNGSARLNVFEVLVKLHSVLT